MKFVKRISLFFIYPLSMFSLGFASNMVLMDYFYPGRDGKTIQLRSGTAEGNNPETAKNNPASDTAEDSAWGTYNELQNDETIGSTGTTGSIGSTGTIEVLGSEEPIITANTQYMVLEYNTITGETVETEQEAPDKFMGLDRDKVAREIQEYNLNPSLTDLEQGFSFMELVSFSPAKVVVRKSYEPPAEDKGFFLVNENHYVVVYDHSLSNIFMNTDILVENLPESLQKEILNMKFIENEGELYNFLESYSS